MRHVPKFVALVAVVAAALVGPAGLASAAAPSATVSAVTPVWGTYQTVAPARVLDTRIGKGAPKAVGVGGTINLSVLGVAGVPATGVSAVVLNVTVTGGTKGGYLTVFPAGTARPTASSINFVAGATRANLVTMSLGTIGTSAGKVSIYNQAGSVQVIADVMGYYVADGATTAGGLYQRATSQRLLDTRAAGAGVLPSGWSVAVAVDYGIVANPHIRALAVNITAVSPTKPGYLAAWDGGAVLPATSTLNFAAGTITPNLAIVPVAPCVDCGTDTGLPSISVINESVGSVHVIVDIVGFYDDGQLGDGLRFRPLTPTRIVDTRTGRGATTFTGNSSKIVTAPLSVAGNDTWALLTNCTAVLPTLSTYLTMWSNDSARPGVSNLNAAKGEIVANAAITEVGLSNKFDIYNMAGTTNVLIDVIGSMEYIPNDVPAVALAAAAAPRIWTSSLTAPSAARSSR